MTTPVQPTDPAATPAEPVVEPAAQAPEATPAETPPTNDLDSQPQWVKDEIAKARREAKNLRDRLKEAEPLVQQAREAEEANKTELQRAQERAQQLETDLATATLSAERNGLAARYSIPEEHFRYIVGNTAEEREEAAVGIAHMLEAARGAQSTPPPTNRPIEGLRPGASPPPPAAPDNAYPESWRPATRART
jgi:hypothetical protein